MIIAPPKIATTPVERTELVTRYFDPSLIGTPDDNAPPTESKMPSPEVETPASIAEAGIKPRPEAGKNCTGSHASTREKPLPASNGSKLPPPPGSYEEAVSTWISIAFPSVLSLINNDVERELRLLLWKEM